MGRVTFLLITTRTTSGGVQSPDTAITIGAALMAIELFLPPQHERAVPVEPIESPAVDGTQE